MCKNENTEHEPSGQIPVENKKTADKSTQTASNPLYDPRFSLRTLKCFQKKRIFQKNSEILYDVEDLIIDRILKKGEINKGKRCLNVYMGPFCFREELLLIHNGKLLVNYKHNLHTICEYFKTSILNDQIASFMDSLAHIAGARDKYFNVFKKFVYQEKLTLIQVFAVFAYWLANFLHGKIFSFCFDVILLLYLSIYSNTLTTDIDSYFISNYLEESLYPEIEEVKRHLISIKIKPMINIIDIEVITEYLCLFFKGMSIGPQ